MRGPATLYVNGAAIPINGAAFESDEPDAPNEAKRRFTSGFSFSFELDLSSARVSTVAQAGNPRGPARIPLTLPPEPGAN